jgi:hypothetical protein
MRLQEESLAVIFYKRTKNRDSTGYRGQGGGGVAMTTKSIIIKTKTPEGFSVPSERRLY